MLDVGCDLVVDPDTYTRSTFLEGKSFVIRNLPLLMSGDTYTARKDGF